MSILNRESDGLYSILLTLVTALIREKEISRDDLISTWGRIPPQEDGKDRLSRLRGTLNRWIALGLFVEDEKYVSLAFDPKKGESVESYLVRIPAICRELAFRSEHGNPLWPEGDKVTEEDLGVTADLCRGLAWCLCQDIYTLPTSWDRGVNDLIKYQVVPGRAIIQNNTRWNGLADWARFLGFAVDTRAGIFFDPTTAVRSELDSFMKCGVQIPAEEFASQLAFRLPVLDTGSYRVEVERALRPEAWSEPPTGSLSTALSFALRRLQKQNVIDLRTLSDANSKLTLTRQGGRVWDSFTHVSLKEKLS
ncbi:protein DpdG [Candidatus Methylomicrobium oryzae]|uniref:protein DpdG n=1 Tax=Candidatus Methylomicrobium oryzae TaxID=2802053 RepID=UPI001921C3C8|nr:protein DpdG [Methylomicrobium sp. RS1]MBL1265486.1 hypothetical protein [Methylomicrobium sp. RS1]